MKLFTYFRSSAAYRVRIALNLKRLPYDAAYVHLLNNGGEQRGAAYDAVNPQHLLPSLEAGGQVLTQSMAIIEYLDEAHPAVPLLPADPLGRARVRALSQAIACDIHPLNNLRVLTYLERQLQVSAEQKNVWYRHWVTEGLAALERQLADSTDTGRFCHGDSVGMADCCLVPQLYNARRFGCELDAYPTLLRINANCAGLAAFEQALPERQADAPAATA